MSGPDEYPGVRQKLEEQAELMRVAAVSALGRSRGGKDLDPHARAWAAHWANRKPLSRPLGTGEPA